MIPCEGCGQNACICLKSTTPVPPTFRSTYQHLPFGITKDQFGVTLFEVIKTIGAIKQLQHYLTLLLDDPRALTVMREREQEKRRHLATLLPQLTDSEDGQIRLRYPEVTSW